LSLILILIPKSFVNTGPVLLFIPVGVATSVREAGGIHYSRWEHYESTKSNRWDRLQSEKGKPKPERNS